MPKQGVSRKSRMSNIYKYKVFTEVEEFEFMISCILFTVMFDNVIIIFQKPYTM